MKNSVYVLPRSEQALEDFQWVRREIVAGKGDASVCEARFVEGLSDDGVEALFNAAREADYAALAKEAKRASSRTHGPPRQTRRSPRGRSRHPSRRLRKRLAEVVEMDFFGAGGRDAAEGLLASIESVLRPAPSADEPKEPARGDVHGRTWVTRTRRAHRPHRQRLADPALHRPGGAASASCRAMSEASAGELRFDMFEAEFTHEGDLCTFEVLLRRFGLKDDAPWPGSARSSTTST